MSLPAITSKKPLWKQQAHYRVVDTVRGKRRILINPGVRKIAPTKTDLRGPRARNLRSDDLLRASKERRWDTVLKRDTGLLDPIFKARREMEQNGIELFPGESVAVRIKVNYNGGASVMGSYDFQQLDGSWVNVPAEFRMSNSSLIEYMQDCADTGRPVIFKTDNFGILEGIREFEPLPDPKLNPSEVRDEFMSITPMKDGRTIYSRFGARSKKVVIPGDYQLAHELDELSMYTDKNLLGERRSPQYSLSDFTGTLRFKHLVAAYIDAVLHKKSSFKLGKKTYSTDKAKQRINLYKLHGATPEMIL